MIIACLFAVGARISGAVTEMGKPPVRPLKGKSAASGEESRLPQGGRE